MSSWTEIDLSKTSWWRCARSKGYRHDRLRIINATKEEAQQIEHADRTVGLTPSEANELLLLIRSP